MKILMIALVTLFSFASFAADCTNFSGRYRMYNADLKITIVQVGCEKVNAFYDNPDGSRIARPMIMDGVQRTVQSDEDVVINESYRFENAQIVFSGENFYKESNSSIPFNGRFFFDGDKNLVEETSYPTGNPEQPVQTIQMTYFRL